MLERRISSPILPLNVDGTRYSPETHRRKTPEIYFTDKLGDVPKLMEKGDMQYFRVEEMDAFVVCPKIYKVNVPPIQHVDNSGKVISEAFYYIDEHILENGDAIYLSYLPPGKQTSEAHWHWYGMFEHYNVVAGNAEMTLGYEKSRNVKLDSYIRVPFGMGHRMKAGDNGILTALYTENPDKRPSGSLHIRNSDVVVAR